MPERSRRGDRRPASARDVVLGSPRHVGLWTLPLFLITALVGATLAGGLAVLYYGQKVAGLESETAGARAQLEQAVADVTTVASAAEAAIEARARQVEERFAEGLPIDSPNDVGVYGIAARHAGGEVRVGSGFTIYSDDTQTWLATNYRLVATGDGFAVETADVFLPGQTIAGRVHNFDRDLDLAIVVLGGGPLPVLPWRPADQAVLRGDPVFLAGIAGPDAPTVVEGSVATANERAIVPSTPVNGFVAGGPLIDASGQVVGISSLDYAPFGAVPGTLTYGVPIRALCQGLLSCTAEDLGIGAGSVLGEEGGTGAMPAPAPTSTAPGPTASPSTPASPSPALSPEPEPTSAPTADPPAQPAPSPTSS